MLINKAKSKCRPEVASGEEHGVHASKATSQYQFCPLSEADE